MLFPFPVIVAELLKIITVPIVFLCAFWNGILFPLSIIGVWWDWKGIDRPHIRFGVGIGMGLFVLSSVALLAEARAHPSEWNGVLNALLLMSSNPATMLTFGSRLGMVLLEIWFSMVRMVPWCTAVSSPPTNPRTARR